MCLLLSVTPPLGKVDLDGDDNCKFLNIVIFWFYFINQIYIFVWMSFSAVHTLQESNAIKGIKGIPSNNS